jgi:hypothetical protein
MEGRRIRLGDVIDDYCQRCRLIMNHGVVGMVGDEVRKVRCNTCMTEHVYKHGRLPKRRREETGKLFAEVLRGLGREADPAPDPGAEEQGEEQQEDRDAAAAEDRGAGPAGPPAVPPSGAASGDDTAEPPAAEETTGGGAAGDAAPGDQPPPPVSEDEATHGVRRKLYTIRRHSGGKPPAPGTPGRGSSGPGKPDR